jgi:DNA-3-methyladenine glycosylase II
MENPAHRKAVLHLRRTDPLLKRVIEEAGPCSIKANPSNFHWLTRCIVYQQLSGKAANTIFGRFTEACGVRTLKPEHVLALEESRMRAVGLSGQKARYVRDLAEKTASGQVRFQRFAKMSDEEIIATLTQVKGVGVWTVQMFLMFSLDRLDVFPVLDLGVRKGMERVYEIEPNSKPAAYEAVAERWKPYRSIASWYMWRALEL